MITINETIFVKRGYPNDEWRVPDKNDFPEKSFRYALALANVIRFSANATLLEHARVMHDMIQFASPDTL